MTRDPRYDILFEPVAIGPLMAKNRFYQVPHCTGMGRARPRTLAAMRGVKAEGGWAVVNTEYCSIDPSSDDTPYPYASLWDAGDIRANALMTEAVHAHGALAGVELWHGGARNTNLASREPILDLTSRPSEIEPIQTRAMDRADIAALRRWHRDAARRAREAGFDIVYVYATHDYLLHHFLSRETNPRSDEYGGSLENRTRILRELIAETRDAVGDRCAVAVRITGGTVDPDALELQEMRDTLSMLGPMADLWDLVVDDYALEMGSARFVAEAAFETAIAEARKCVGGKPVVSVGRFTSPDTMARLVRQGVLDFIGAARPSIADPFLPNKIAEGRHDEIRECIGCNVCYATNSRGAPIRCTQNPTMGEEWRRGWHPERVPAKASDDAVLIVGGGPAGLEAARTLGQRGYRVTLADARGELGGRVSQESRLPGLAAWARVRDHRLQQISQMANVTTYLESAISAQEVLELGSPVVAIATGARWRKDGVGRFHRTPVAGFDHPQVFTPDDLMAPTPAILPDGPVAVFDDDRYYMAAVLAELLVQRGHEVTLVTPAGCAGAWGSYTEEDHLTNKRLLELGVAIQTNRVITSFTPGAVETRCVFTGKPARIEANALLSVTARSPADALYHALVKDSGALKVAGIRRVTRLGDALAPALIAHAVYAGHRFAREFDDEAARAPVRREAVEV
jgi:dimethylamine/trimethylamine dehydrogenase